MTASLINQRANYRTLSGNRPVGRVAQIFAGEYAGTITQVWRLNDLYWTVTTREVGQAFAHPRVGVTAHVWRDSDGRYVADYTHHQFGPGVEITRCYDVRAALSAAITHTSETGHKVGRW